MKKILLSSIMTVVVSTVGYLGMTANKTESEIALDANVEALATGETATEGEPCYNTITSKDGCQVRYCPVCNFIPGTDVCYSLSDTCSPK